MELALLNSLRKNTLKQILLLLCHTSRCFVCKLKKRVFNKRLFNLRSAHQTQWDWCLPLIFAAILFWPNHVESQYCSRKRCSKTNIFNSNFFVINKLHIRCDSSRTSRSWWIAHSTQRQPRVCNSSPEKQEIRLWSEQIDKTFIQKTNSTYQSIPVLVWKSELCGILTWGTIISYPLAPKFFSFSN